MHENMNLALLFYFTIYETRKIDDRDFIEATLHLTSMDKDKWFMETISKRGKGTGKRISEEGYYLHIISYGVVNLYSSF